MTKLEELNNRIIAINSLKMVHEITKENGIYILYLNGEYVLCGRPYIFEDILHGYIIGYLKGK